MRLDRRAALAVLTAALLTGSAAGQAAADGSSAPSRERTTQARSTSSIAADRMYHTWATDVNLRANEADQATCSRYPSVRTCPDVRQRVQPHHQLYVYCQKQGQTVGGNPYWLLVNDYTDSNTGWLASYYIDYPDNRLPDVPDC
ncbi:hypothetical protein ABZ330_17775 [Streptomyces sp. NPDC006172]|uniref:hypothetical protein n=1 Tax=Streptomyces sp. NPDC006172 TaxID=3154470 RepID=UPI003402716E